MSVVEDVLKMAHDDLMKSAKLAVADAKNYAEKATEMAEYSQKCLTEASEVAEALANERDHIERVSY